MDIQTLITQLGPEFGVLAVIGAALKSKRVRRMIMAGLSEDTALNQKITTAVETSIAALQAALELRAGELSKMETELAELQTEVRALKEADDRKTARINELEAEISVLRRENDELRTELERRRGGRPKKHVADI